MSLLQFTSTQNTERKKSWNQQTWKTWFQNFLIFFFSFLLMKFNKSVCVVFIKSFSAICHHRLQKFLLFVELYCRLQMFHMRNVDVSCLSDYFFQNACWIPAAACSIMFSRDWKLLLLTNKNEQNFHFNYNNNNFS